MNVRWQKSLIDFIYHAIIFVLFVVGINAANALLITIGIADLLIFRKLPLVRIVQVASCRLAQLYPSSILKPMAQNG